MIGWCLNCSTASSLFDGEVLLNGWGKPHALDGSGLLRRVGCREAEADVHTPLKHHCGRSGGSGDDHLPLGV